MRLGRWFMDLTVFFCGPGVFLSWSRLAGFKLLAQNEVSRSMSGLRRACLLAIIEQGD